MSAPFDSQRFTSLIGGLPLGRPLVLTSVTDSTNDDALAAAREGAPHGAVFVTEEQRRGRGRRGNAWYAAPGLIFTWGEHFSASLNVDVPLRIYNRAFQTVPDYRIRAGITYRF